MNTSWFVVVPWADFISTTAVRWFRTARCLLHFVAAEFIYRRGYRWTWNQPGQTLTSTRPSSIHPVTCDLQSRFSLNPCHTLPFLASHFEVRPVLTPYVNWSNVHFRYKRWHRTLLACSYAVWEPTVHGINLWNALKIKKSILLPRMLLRFYFYPPRSYYLFLHTI